METNKKMTLLQRCPVCDCSWRGASFYWIYKNADEMYVRDEIKRLQAENAKLPQPKDAEELEQLYPKPLSPTALKQAVRKNHGKMTNQSTLISASNGYLCPTCKTQFLKQDFE